MKNYIENTFPGLTLVSLFIFWPLMITVSMDNQSFLVGCFVSAFTGVSICGILNLDN